MPVAKTQPVYPPDPGKALEADWGIAASEHVIQRFTDIADRNAKWTNPPTGAACVTTIPSLVSWTYDGSAWIPLGGILVGEIKIWPGAAVPINWITCDGRALSRTTYAALFNAIGTVWGAGDGTTFNIPDMRGRAPIGVGTGAALTARALAAKVGAEVVALGPGELPWHTHSIDHDHAPFTSGAGSNHGHSGTTGGQSANHVHESGMGVSWNFIVQSRNVAPLNSGLTLGQANAHVEETNTTNWAASDHSHNFSTSGEAAHTHPIDVPYFSGGSGAAGASPAAGHNNMQPSVVINFIIYAGAG